MQIQITSLKASLHVAVSSRLVDLACPRPAFRCARSQTASRCYRHLQAAHRTHHIASNGVTLPGRLLASFASDQTCNMAEATESIKLNSGEEIPAVGLGVYKSAPGDETVQAVLSALKLGYRHIDTAQAYSNEAEVGKAIKDSGIDRSSIWVTSKVWLSNFGYEKAIASVKQSVRAMGLDYIDLMLLHAPGDAELRADTWRALEDAKEQGLLRNIGVSNFGIPHLEKLLATAKYPPAVNQIELHPYLQRRDVVEYCKLKGIALEAYSPLAKGEKLNDPLILRIANKYGVSPAQVLIRWGLQNRYIVLPKSVNPERQAGNLAVFSFSLQPEDVEELDKLEEGLITGWDPITQHEV